MSRRWQPGFSRGHHLTTTYVTILNKAYSQNPSLPYIEFESLKFLIDTGAECSLINSELFRRKDGGSIINFYILVQLICGYILGGLLLPCRDLRHICLYCEKQIRKIMNITNKVPGEKQFMATLVLILTNRLLPFGLFSTNTLLNACLEKKRM